MTPDSIILSTWLTSMMLLVTAPPPRVALLEVHDGAPACVAIEQLRADVTARLDGRDPFEEGAARRMELRWSRRQRQFVARIDVIEPDGQSGERVLVDRSCDELVPAVALAIAIAIDPRVALGPLPPEVAPRITRALEDETRVARAGPEAPVFAPRPRPRAARWWHVGGALQYEMGAAPGNGVAFGPRLELGAVWRAGVEAGLVFGFPAAVGATDVSTFGVYGRAELCYSRVLYGCVGLAFTHTRFGADEGLSAPIDEGRDTIAALMSVGVRPSRYVAFVLGAALPVTPLNTITDAGTSVWRAEPVQASLRVVITQ